MSRNNPSNEKKKALLAYKEKLLEDIRYYDYNIENFRASYKNNSYFEDADSSDPEDYFPDAADMGPQASQLRRQQSMLKTCLQATQELTGLTVLQSEVNVMVQDPEFEGERPVNETGTWKEVTAECRIDLVPFTIAFYMHTPDRKFAPSSYRALQVALIKSPHEIELNKSVLQTLKRPSDAVEVVRSYAMAYRSRRTTLATLAKKYASSLYMEPHAEGGFVLKCANLLEILWRLENKWSPVAPFHHRMKFDLEYMEESYINIITQAHKQLLDPSIETDERTLLLSKIIATCLEARGPVDTESDVESRLTDAPAETETKDKDSEVMAPPKSLPKKTKKIAKGKDFQKDVEKPMAQKRGLDMEKEEENAKKIKANDELKKNSYNISSKQTKGKENINSSKKTISNEDVIKKKSSNMAKKINTANKKSKQNDNADNLPDGDKMNNNVDKNKKVDNAKVGKKRKNEETTQFDNKNQDINEKESKKAKNTKASEDCETATKKTESKNIKGNINAKENKKKNDLAKKTSNNVLDEGNKKTDNIVEYEEFCKAIAKENTQKSKNDGTQKKIDKKTKMSIANDKKFDQITKKLSGNIDNKDGDTKSKKEKKSEAKNVTTKENAVSKLSVEKKSNDVDRFDQITKKMSGKIDNRDGEAKSKTDKKIQAKNSTTSNNDKAVSKITVEKTLRDVDRPKSKNIENERVANTINYPKQKTGTEKVIEKPKLKNTSNTKKQNVPASSQKSNQKNSIDVFNLKNVTEKNANIIKNKEKIMSIKTAEKVVKNKTPEAHKITKNNVKNQPKLTIKSVKNIHKSPAQKNLLKPQNQHKTGKTQIPNGNTKLFSGSIEKENVGKSKIPQKKTSLNNENNLKNVILRISPRKLPSKFKTTSEAGFVKNITKNTNIPRLLKKPVPK